MNESSFSGRDDQFTLAQSPKCRLTSSVYVYDAVSLQQINRPRPRVGQPYGSSDCTQAQYNRLPTGPGSLQPEKPTREKLMRLSHRPRRAYDMRHGPRECIGCGSHAALPKRASTSERLCTIVATGCPNSDVSNPNPFHKSRGPQLFVVSLVATTFCLHGHFYFLQNRIPVSAARSIAAKLKAPSSSHTRAGHIYRRMVPLKGAQEAETKIRRHGNVESLN